MPKVSRCEIIREGKKLPKELLVEKKLDSHFGTGPNPILQFYLSTNPMVKSYEHT